MDSAIPHGAGGYLIGQAARLSGISAANIRFYEKEGLVQAQGTTTSSYRLYSDENIHRLRFIRRLRSLDMSLDEMRTLLTLDLRRKPDCATARETLDAHIAHVKQRLAELRALEKDLATLRSRCDGETDRCLLIETLHRDAASGRDRHALNAVPRQGIGHKATGLHRVNKAAQVLRSGV
jgi:DNA-binding transcriptional MerR regulator